MWLLKRSLGCPVLWSFPQTSDATSGQVQEGLDRWGTQVPELSHHFGYWSQHLIHIGQHLEEASELPRGPALGGRAGPSAVCPWATA